MSDPTGKDPGLAGPGSGHDQQRAAPVLDGLALLRIQIVEQRLRSGGSGFAVLIAGLLIAGLLIAGLLTAGA